MLIIFQILKEILQFFISENLNSYPPLNIFFRSDLNQWQVKFASKIKKFFLILFLIYI